MILLEDLVAGQRVRGLAVSGPVTVEVVNRHGPDTVSVIFTESTGGVGRELLSRADQERLFVETIGLLPPLDADANEFKLAATEWDMIIFDEALGYNRLIAALPSIALKAQQLPGPAREQDLFQEELTQIWYHYCVRIVVANE